MNEYIIREAVKGPLVFKNVITSVKYQIPIFLIRLVSQNTQKHMFAFMLSVSFVISK